MNKLRGVKLDSSIEMVYQRSLNKIYGYHDAIDRLERELQAFPDKLALACTSNEFLDQKLANELHASFSKLLTLCRSVLSASDIPYALAAIDYFVTAQDGSADFNNLDGFEDDKAVLDAVSKLINIDIDQEYSRMAKGA
jgi:hypothetical protein